jgi:Zn-dependent protease
MAGRSGGRWVFPATCAITAVGLVGSARAWHPLGVWIFVAVLGGWVVTLCLHEFAHSVLALAGGDTSVRARGYLTLNPLRYTDPANSLIIPIIVLAIGGIPLPGGAVLVEPGRLRHRWWSSVVSAGGPATNLVIGALLAPIGAHFDSGLGVALSYLALLQFGAGILNLLPVPPFDGFGIIAPYLPRRFMAALAPYRVWIPLVVFGILFLTPGAAAWLWNPANRLLETFGGSPYAALVGSSLFQFWR